MTDSHSALTALLKREKPPEWGQKHTVWIHGDDTSSAEMFINFEIFGRRQGQVAIIVNPVNEKRVYISVSDIAYPPFQQSANFGISIHETLAELLEVGENKEVYIDFDEPRMVPAAAKVVIGFRDQYIGRVSMVRISDAISKSCTYRKKSIDLSKVCIQAYVHSLFSPTNEVFHYYRQYL